MRAGGAGTMADGQGPAFLMPDGDRESETRRRVLVVDDEAGVRESLRLVPAVVLAPRALQASSNCANARWAAFGPTPPWALRRML